MDILPNELVVHILSYVQSADDLKSIGRLGGRYYIMCLEQQVANAEAEKRRFFNDGITEFRNYAGRFRKRGVGYPNGFSNFPFYCDRCGEFSDIWFDEYELRSTRGICIVCDKYVCEECRIDINACYCCDNLDCAKKFAHIVFNSSEFVICEEDVYNYIHSSKVELRQALVESINMCHDSDSGVKELEWD